MKVFFDVDTQHDFMDKDGKLHVPNAESLYPALAMLTQYAVMNNIPILGSVDRHFGTEDYRCTEGELKRWGGPFPDHCMDGTRGQEKIPVTTLPKMICIPQAHEERVFSPNLVTEYPMILFEKQHYDVFTNLCLSAAIRDMHVTEAYVYGVATDYCVKAAVLGLLHRGVRTNVILDAICGVDDVLTLSAVELMKRRGARFVSMTALLKLKFKHRRGI